MVVVVLGTKVDLWRDVSSPRWDLKQRSPVPPESQGCTEVDSASSEHSGLARSREEPYEGERTVVGHEENQLLEEAPAAEERSADPEGPHYPSCPAVVREAKRQLPETAFAQPL